MSSASDKQREDLIKHIHQLINYWDQTDFSSKEKMENLAFSILTVIDGSAIPLPGYHLIPVSDNASLEDDISGGLHEIFYSLKEEEK